MLQKIEKWVRHPFSGLSHLTGAVLAFVGLIALLIAAGDRPWHLASFAVYGVTLVLVFLASGLYHTLHVSPRGERALFGFDRAAIYTLIAGTYTPICLIALGGGWGWSLFGIVWGLAVVGIVTDIIARQRTPDWVQGIFYVLMGWLFVVAIWPLIHALSWPALLWLLAGCLIYTFGAVVCVTNRPRLAPTVFGAHDLWHALVIAGSACHFVLMLCFVARL